MVEVIGSFRLNGSIRDSSTSRDFPSAELEMIESAIEAVDDAVFLDNQSGNELVTFDERVGGNLPGYEYEPAPESGRTRPARSGATRDSTTASTSITRGSASPSRLRRASTSGSVTTS